MLKRIVLSIVLVFLSNTSNASDAGKYVQLSFYGVYQDDQEFDTRGGASREFEYHLGVGFGGAFGYAFGGGLRAEAEFAARSNSVDEVGISGEYNSYAFMANGVFDFPTNSKFQPYVGGGVGMVHVTDSDVKDQVFGYQFLAGVNYNVTDNGQFVIGYRYLGTNDAKLKTNTKITDASYETQNIELGYRFKF